MGTITTRKTKAGKIRYRAEIRKNITGYPPFSESKTFSKQSAAEAWLRKRETEIEAYRTKKELSWRTLCL